MMVVPCNFCILAFELSPVAKKQFARAEEDVDTLRRRR